MKYARPIKLQKWDSTKAFKIALDIPSRPTLMLFLFALSPFLPLG
jgi:hypothetical protein